MKNLFEVVKENKDRIIKGALIVGGTVLGAILATSVDTKYDDDFEDYELGFDEAPEDEVVIDITPEEEK